MGPGGYLLGEKSEMLLLQARGQGGVLSSQRGFSLLSVLATCRS